MTLLLIIGAHMLAVYALANIVRWFLAVPSKGN